MLSFYNHVISVKWCYFSNVNSLKVMSFHHSDFTSSQWWNIKVILLHQCDFISPKGCHQEEDTITQHQGFPCITNFNSGIQWVKLHLCTTQNTQLTWNKYKTKHSCCSYDKALLQPKSRSAFQCFSWWWLMCKRCSGRKRHYRGTPGNNPEKQHASNESISQTKNTVLPWQTRLLP